MRSAARAITHTEHKGLRAIRRPVMRVVKIACVPRDLVQDLRNLHRVRGWARAACLKAAGRGVRDV